MPDTPHSPYATRLTQAEYDHQIANPPPPRGLPGLVAPIPTNTGGREVEAFQKVVHLEAANQIHARPEPTTQEEFNARGHALNANAAKLGLHVMLMAPSDASTTGPLGLFHPGGGMPESFGTISEIEHIVAIRLAQKVSIDAVRAAADKRSDEVNRAIAEGRKRQEFQDNGPAIIEELRAEIATLRSELAYARNAATNHAVTEPVIAVPDDNPESVAAAIAQKSALANFANRFRS
jgi:hypothetical protein